VLNRVNHQVDTLTALNRQTDLARDMIYKVTVQMHYRAMALVTDTDEEEVEYDGKLLAAKEAFLGDLAAIRAFPEPDRIRLETGSLVPRTQFFDDLAAANETFAASSEQVAESSVAGDTARALDLHLGKEHPISHQLEGALNSLIADSEERVVAETAAFKSDRRFLTIAVASFSVLSLLGALLLGAVLSWSLIRPVRRVDTALASIADGDFATRVEVPNRDEFGSLSSNLNR